MTLAIRPAVSADLPRCTVIYAHEVRTGMATFELDPPDLAEMARRFEAVTAGGHPYLVATRAGDVVGFAYTGPYRARPAYHLTVENSIYLDGAHRGHGIGGRLLAALIEESQARGFHQMIAVIGNSANVSSIRLHARAGFAHRGTLIDVGQKFGRWVDTVLMQKTLR